MATSPKAKKLDFIVEGARNLTSAVSFTLGPGLNFFEGVNGAGKSTLLQSLAAWAGRKMDIPVADGAKKIRVHGPQAVVEIGRTRKEDGSPSVEFFADDTFGELVEPSGKDPKVREKNRVDAFLRLRPVEITSELLLRLCGGDETIAAAVQAHRSDWQTMSIDEAAEEARRWANDMAKPLEDGALTSKASGSTLLRQAEELAEQIVEVPEETAEDLAAQVDRVSRSLGEMKLKVEARADLEAQQKAIRGSLGPRPDLQSLEANVAIAEQEVKELAAKLRDAEARSAAARQELRSAEKVDREWQRSSEILNRPMAGPTAEDLGRTEEALAALREKLAAAELEARRTQLKGEAVKHLDASREAEQRAARYRAIAQTAKADVGKILSELGIEGVTFIDGALAAETPTGVRPVAEQSFGERVDFALRVALPPYEESELPPVFWLKEAFWYALQPKKQDALEALAKERGIYFLIERPTDGELQVRNRAANDVRPSP